VRKALDYGIGLGHRKIAIIEGKAGFKSTTERKQGFMDSLIAHRLPLVPDYFTAGDYGVESGYNAMMSLLSLSDPPTLVFCSNDDMAIGALNACYARGYTYPPLTTIRKPIADISKLGTTKLIERLEQPDSAPEQLFVQTELIVRQSVAAVT
ncbi:hypothetical protein BGX30_008780, partial [Mortierella sp. GBA39]